MGVFDSPARKKIVLVIERECQRNNEPYGTGSFVHKDYDDVFLC